MTWTKLGTEFFDECAADGLSDAAVRTHAEAIGWIYRVEQDDLWIPKAMVRRFATSDRWESAIAELVRAGYWVSGIDAYVIVHHGDVIRQSITAQRAKRGRDRRDQQAKRDRLKHAKQRSTSVTDVLEKQRSKSVTDVSTDTDSQKQVRSTCLHAPPNANTQRAENGATERRDAS